MVALTLLLLGLPPGAPEVPTMAGGIAPGTTAASTEAGMAFHGFLSAPLRLGFATRMNPTADQSDMVLHAPPRLPEDRERFGYTALFPDPWVQLNFSYVQAPVTATVVVAARTITNASGYFNPPDMIGMQSAFLSLRLPLGEDTHLTAHAGAFARSYGDMGEHALGRYGTPLIARIGGVGAMANAVMGLGDVELAAEGGFMGQLRKAPNGVEAAGWNDFADPNVGTSFVPHLHLWAKYKTLVQVGGHYLRGFTRDDRALAKGSIKVTAIDARLTMGRFGHLYSAAVLTNARTARSVSAVLSVLNAPGGRGLMADYFDPTSDGTGTLYTTGAQYDLGLGSLLRGPARDGPDIVTSLFGVFCRADLQRGYIDKAKYGTEAMYSLLSWFAAGARYDRVLHNLRDDAQTSAVLTARALFRSDWDSRDQVVVQYSRWLNGSGTLVADGYPPRADPTIVPDRHTVSLTASMWW